MAKKRSLLLATVAALGRRRLGDGRRCGVGNRVRRHYHIGTARFNHMFDHHS